jgi:4-hydroxy-3-polyprenylbenzoate decarboxylase
MNVPFASGSNPPDAMVVIPCSMGTLGRIAHGLSSDSLLRCADVMLKERRKLLLRAGAQILPANPSYYTRPQTVQDVADTVVGRVLDHLGAAHNLVARWQDEPE